VIGLWQPEDGCLVYCAECTALRREDIPDCFCGETAYTYEPPPVELCPEPVVPNYDLREAA
jgi:hypothetical protein